MASGNSAARADFKGGLAWSVLGAAIFAGAWRMDRYEAMGATLYTAPGLVPGIFGLVLVVLGAALAFRARSAMVKAAAADDDGEPERLINRRIAITLALTLGYAAVLIGRVPFSVATAVFVAAFTWTFTDAPSAIRRLVTAIAAGLITTIVIVAVFEKVFLVRLP